MKVFCKHEWKLVSETTTKSKFEHAASNLDFSAGVEIKGGMCCTDRKFIQIVSCDKCGKLKRFVEEI